MGLSLLKKLWLSSKSLIKFNLDEENSSNEENEKKEEISEENENQKSDKSLDYYSDTKDEPNFDWIKPKFEDLNSDDDIIMCSTYVPFNPKREKDGSIDFVLTNESIYHTLYRVIKDKKNIKWFGNLKSSIIEDSNGA